MNKQLNSVKEFHQTFGQPAPEIIDMLTPARVEKRANWSAEEVREFRESPDIYEQVDAQIDIIYFALGSLVEMGIFNVDKLFEIVQNANMSKLWEDGKPHFREDGKIIKPKTWVDPKPLLKIEIDRQIELKNNIQKAA